MVYELILKMWMSRVFGLLTRKFSGLLLKTYKQHVMHKKNCGYNEHPDFVQLMPTKPTQHKIV